MAAAPNLQLVPVNSCFTGYAEPITRPLPTVESVWTHNSQAAATEPQTTVTHKLKLYPDRSTFRIQGHKSDFKPGGSPVPPGLV